MQSLRVDNDRLNQLVKREHNSLSTHYSTAEPSDLCRVASDQKLPPDCKDLSLPTKSLGMCKLIQC